MGGTLRPGDHKRVMVREPDPRMSPDEMRRARAGFWTKEYRVDRDETVWRCDLHKLHERVRDVMMDPMEAQRFRDDPHGYLDMMFGDGTARAYFTKHPTNERYMNYLMPRDFRHDMREREMAMSYASLYGGTATTASTNTITTTSATDATYWFREEQRKQIKRAVSKHLDPPRSETFKWNRFKKITPNLIEPAKRGLVESLQKAFDTCYAKELRLLRG